MSEKQLEELIALLDKEQIIETEEKIEKAIAKSIKQADETKKIAEQIQMNEKASSKYEEDLKDTAKVIKDNATNLEDADKKNVFKTDV